MRSKQSAPKFAIRELEAVVGKQTFFELTEHGVGCLALFEQSLAGTTYESELRTIVAYMDLVANLRSLPETKFKDITGPKETIREYEFKSKHLRVYAVQKTGGKVVVVAGFKTTQKADIDRMRRIKKEIAERLLNQAAT